MTNKVQEYGTINEHIKPIHVIAGTPDNVIIIKVKTTYCHEKIRDNEIIPLTKLGVRDRYVIIKSFSPMFYDSELARQFNETTGTFETKLPVRTLIVPSPPTSIIVPDDFWPAIVDDQQVPLNYEVMGKLYALNEPVPYNYNGRLVYLDFQKVKIESTREHIRWWTYPALYMGIIVDTVCYIPAMIISAPVVAAGWIVMTPYLIIKKPK